MKIRNGFVSNSSSSSFVLFGIQTAAKNITSTLLKQKNIVELKEAFRRKGKMFLVFEYGK